MIPFAEWLPDLPALNNPGATVALNCLPQQNGYGPLPSMNVISNALAKRAQGAFAARDAVANVYVYAGDQTQLYALGSGAFSGVGKSGGYNTAIDDRWEFIQWGNSVIAVNYNDAPQQITIAAGQTFADLAGSPPKARHIGVVRDFVVMGNTYDADGALPNRVRWSGINDATAWTPSAATQSDYQDLQGDGGWVQAIVGGDYGVILQERAIWRMSYAGTPTVFQFDLLENNRGTPVPGSVINIGRYVFYLGQDGFYVFNGVWSEPIGKNKIDDTFFADLDSAFAYRISAARDPVHPLLYWAYPAAGNSNGNPNKLLIYNWALQRWTQGEITTEYLVSSQAQGYTIDSLDSFSSNLDSLPYSLDSRLWTGGAPVLAAFDASHQMNVFNGAPLTATLETAEAQLIPGQRALLRGVMPQIDGGTPTITAGVRNRQTDAVVWGSPIAINGIGVSPQRANGRYHRLRATVSGGFTHAQGVSVDAVGMGVR